MVNTRKLTSIILVGAFAASQVSAQDNLRDCELLGVQDSYHAESCFRDENNAIKVDYKGLSREDVIVINENPNLGFNGNAKVGLNSSFYFIAQINGRVHVVYSQPK